MKLKVKKLHQDAVLPSRAHATDAGLDMTAIDNGRQVYETDPKTGIAHRFMEYRTGIAVEIPAGYVGLIFPRSSITKKNFMLKNSVGVIDAGYRGEVMFRFAIDSEEIYTIYTQEAIGMGLDDDSIHTRPGMYSAGDRIGQMIVMPIPEVEVEEVVELDDTSDRGAGGFGSTGA